MRCSCTDVGETRHVFEDQRLLGEQARDHQRQRGVLGAGNRDRAVKRLAADDANAIHGNSPCWPERPVPVLLVGGNSGGIVGFRGSRGFRRGRAPALAALEVFPQRRLQALFAQRLFRRVSAGPP